MKRPATLLRDSWRRASIAGVLVLSIFALGQALPGGEQASGEASARSVWDGVFTDEQADRGRRFYAEHCAGCHGANLQGGEYRALTGDRFWASWQDTTVDRFLGHITANMPHSEDGSLKGTLGAPVYQAIVAYILRANEFPAGASELTETSSVGVRIARKDGSGELPSGAFVHVVGCLARGSGRDWRLLQGTPPSRVLTGESFDVNVPLGDREYTLMFVLTSLDKFVGHRMSVRASLMGDGGKEGLNVTSITSVSETCD
jgi:S-disulfanyl-L-cysteine oxidoreductase SoxD